MRSEPVSLRKSIIIAVPPICTYERVLTRPIYLIRLRMMQKAINELKVPDSDYSNCQQSVRLMHEAGVPILAGTDSNAIPDSPAHLEHGRSIHDELELLVKAGLSPIEALRSVTSVAAKEFGLDDRGVIAQGYRADLVLLEGDPTKDIRETRRIRRVWCGGVEVV